MIDDSKVRRRLVLDKLIANLTEQHKAIIESLHEAIARENSLPPWELLNEAAKAVVVQEALEQCEAIARNPEVWWEAQVEPLDEVAELVAAQYRLVRRIHEVEADKLATFRPTLH